MKRRGDDNLDVLSLDHSLTSTCEARHPLTTNFQYFDILVTLWSAVLLPLLSHGGLRKGALAGIVVGSILGASVILVGILLVYRKLHPRMQVEVGKKEPCESIFTFVTTIFPPTFAATIMIL